MIAALIIFGLIATIPLLILVSFGTINFIHGYKKFQKRDDDLDYAIIDYSTLKRLYQINPDGYELSNFGQLYRMNNYNGWMITREVRIVFKTIFDYIHFEIDKKYNKKASQIVKRCKQEEQGLSKLRDLAQQDIDNLRAKLDAEFEQEKKKIQEIAVSTRQPLNNLKPFISLNGNPIYFQGKQVYIDGQGDYFTKDGEPISIS